LSRQVLTTQAIELDAFARLMRAHTLLRRQLETEVLVPRGLTFNDFEALMHLNRADDNRLRRIDLAEALMLSPSGVTRLLDGMQAAGFVENRHCDDDARVTWAALTDEGRRTLECVGVNHADLLRAHFRETLDDDEVLQLTELLGRLPGVDGASCTS
jgi:DNA-binding MarR family transcriptional regulator